MSVAVVTTRRVLGLALACSLAVTGCTVFPQPEAPRVMDFPKPRNIETGNASKPQSLRIDTPSASEPYNSSRILAKPEPWEFRVYGGVRWRDTTPVILRDMLAGAFRASSTFSNVTLDTSPGNTDLTLATEVNAFHAISHGDSTRVTIAVYGQLINNRSRRTLCSNSFITSTPAGGPDIDSVVRAFGDAGKQLAKEIIQWAGQCETRPDQPFSGNKSGQAAFK